MIKHKKTVSWLDPRFRGSNIAIQGNGILDYFGWRKNIIECCRTRSTKSKQKNMNRTSNERPYQPKENKDQELGAYYELTEMNGKATEYKHIGEATQQIEQQHVRSSLKSQKMVITLY